MLQDFGSILFLIPAVSFFIDVIIQLLTFRLMAIRGLLFSEYAGFLSGLLMVFLFEFHVIERISMIITDNIAIFIANLIIYCALAYCYFSFINLGETARRVRILRELYEAKKSLSMEEILERYTAQEIVKKRISRLLKNNQIKYRESRYYLDNRLMLLIALMITSLKVIVFGKNRGIKP